MKIILISYSKTYDSMNTGFVLVNTIECGQMICERRSVMFETKSLMRKYKSVQIYFE
jgi:hypothetical protein